LSGVEGEALLDTGATVSGIMPRLIRRLGLRPIGKRPLGSARGEAQVERYLFRVGLRNDERSPEHPSFPHVFDETVGFELTDSFTLDALIGMDVLSQCELIMRRNKHWTLRFG
jgi:hypothetical protein